MTPSEKILALRAALADAHAMQRELEQLLASDHPGEDWAICQLQGGTSTIERSMMLRLRTHKKTLTETTPTNWDDVRKPLKEGFEALLSYLETVSPHIASRAEFMVLYDAIQKELK